jgi:hypothetical protein
LRDIADYHVFRPPATPEESGWDAVDADLVAAAAAAKAAAKPLFVLLTDRHLTAWGQRLAAHRGTPKPPLHPIHVHHLRWVTEADLCAVVVSRREMAVLKDASETPVTGRVPLPDEVDWMLD